MTGLTVFRIPLYNRMVKRVCTALLALAWTCLPLPAQAKAPYTYQLPSGLTVILAPIPGMQATCVLTYHKNGVRHDPPAIRGASFLYQYLMMLATENLEDYDRLMFIRKNGGESNARVGIDFAYFSQLIPDHTIANALWLEHERLTSLLFFNQAINSQKQSLFQRLSTLLKENIFVRAQEWVRSKVMENTVYQEPAFGSLEMLRNLDNRSIRSRYPVFQNPQNIILVLCGSLNIRESVALIREHFQLRNNSQALKQTPFEVIPPRDKAVNETWRTPQADQNAIIYGIRAPGMYSKDYLGFQLLYTFLSDPRYSQLDKILNQNNHLNIQISRETTHQFEANAVIFRIASPSRLAIEKAAYLVNRLLNALFNEKLSNNDLRQARTLMEIDLRKEKLDPEKRALWHAQQYHMFGPKGRGRSREQALGSLNLMDLHLLCRKYLSPENRVILNVYKK